MQTNPHENRWVWLSWGSAGPHRHESQCKWFRGQNNSLPVRFFAPSEPTHADKSSLAMDVLMQKNPHENRWI